VRRCGVSTPFVTPMRRVEVVQTGRDRLEARHPATGQLLGTACRSRGSDCEWIGWLVEAGRHRQVAATIASASALLSEFAASTLDGGR